jgi:hypothetical protein
LISKPLSVLSLVLRYFGVNVPMRHKRENIIIGIASSISATIGEKTVERRAKKLQIPKAVAQNSTGKS